MMKKNPLKKLFNSLSLGMKFMLFLGTIIFTWVAVLGVYNYKHQKSDLLAFEKNVIIASAQGIMEHISMESHGAYVMAKMIAEDPEAGRLLGERDRQGLREKYLPLFQKINEAVEIKQFQFHIPPATSFLRLHKPDKFGDDLSAIRPTVVNANKDRTSQIGLDVGVFGIGIRGVVPVQYEGKHVGSVEFGKAVNDRLMQSLQETFKVNVAVALPEGGRFKTIASTRGDIIPRDAFKEIQGVVDSGNEYTEVVDIEEGTHLRCYSPLVDYSGAAVGVIAVSKDITQSLAEVESLATTNIIAGLVAAALLLLVAYLAVRFLVASPLNTMVKKMQAINNNKADLRDGLDDSRNDEIGKLAGWFNTLMLKIDDMLSEALIQASIINALPDPILAVDEKKKIIAVNDVVLKQTGKRKEDIIGKTCGDIMEGNVCGTKNCPMEEVSKTNALCEEEVVRTVDGKERYYRALAGPIFDGNNNRIGFFDVTSDISEIIEKKNVVQIQQKQIMDLGIKINEMAQGVAESSEYLNSSADEQAKGAQRQKEQSEGVATAMEEMTASALEVAGNAGETSKATEQASISAHDGMELVRETEERINKVGESSQRLEHVLDELDGQAGEIERIISVINDIADQTNLLALNAAIEAARAGDAGRGFAVVADEVRKLAEKTMHATNEVEQSVGKIQEGSKHALHSMGDTKAQVEASIASFTQVNSAFEGIMGQVQDVSTRVVQIATAAEEQSNAAEEINRSLEEISMIAKEAESGAEHSVESTKQLADLAQNLLSVSSELSQKKSDGLKLRASKGEMKGILPKIMADYVKEVYGRPFFREMMEDMGDPTFLPMSGYPDQVLMQMADFVAEHKGATTRDVFLSLGEYTVPVFHKLYKKYFRTSDLKEFFMTMNETHKKLSENIPGANPPKFTYEDRGDTLIMTYHSMRGYHDYFEGIIKGVAKFFGQQIHVSVAKIDEDTARAEIRLR